MNISNEYIAGFVDGEAYIGLIKKKSNKCKLGYYYKPNVKVTQRTKNAYVLKLMMEKYGGYLTTKLHSPVSNQCDIDVWEISSRPSVSKLLNDIKDYSVVKKDVINLLIEFMSLPFTHHDSSHNERKEDIYLKMRKINRRGLAETK